MQAVGSALFLLVLAACGVPTGGVEPDGRPRSVPVGESVALTAVAPVARFRLEAGRAVDLVVEDVVNPRGSWISLQPRWHPGNADGAGPAALAPVGLFPVDAGGRFRLALPDAASQTDGVLDVRLESPSPDISVRVRIDPVAERRAD